ncbi:MAG: ice-binding family protein [Candidatus Delongbacteria bacterium]|nr:ice-binding family protein [Candidatus Delongbacteria bacterium]
MKMNKILKDTVLKFWAQLFGAILLVALIAPSTIMCQQPPVNLGSTARFAILAGSLITNNPTSEVTGDVGLSPAAGTNISGFGLSEVVGTIYTVDATGPAGSVEDASMLTTAQGDLTIAYNDAAERTPVPAGEFLNPGFGNLGNQILVPGLYKFTGTAEITAGNLTFDAQNDSNAVFIMMVATGLNTASGTEVILINKARAENIFWQVGTSAALGTYSIFKGTIMADQSVTMGTGASIEGRLLASIAAVTIDACTITLPASEIEVPANVVTSISGSDIVIDWDVSAGATSYDVYSSDDPYGIFAYVTSVPTNQYEVAYTAAKKFYYIVATDVIMTAPKTIKVTKSIRLN